MHDWKETTLWQALTTREGTENARLLLQNVMPDAQSVLSTAGTAAPDFTLHDSEHGFRVSQMMADILADRLDMISPAEITLLLLSAYLHDIGMNPSRGISRSHYSYLLTGDKGSLTPRAVTEIQQWLDTYYAGATPPLSPSDMDGVLFVEQVHAYYCRHKHNDWSEIWIREHITDAKPPLYPGWVEDLITLCRSHHDGLQELKGDRFSAKLVGTPASVVNLRYLACVLRLSDVLEFDPERTPDVILRHRDISPASRIYWYKDHSISFHVGTDHQLRFTARTPNAALHKAVLETAAGVDQELSVCSTLDREGALLKGAIPDDIRAIYKWPWPPRLAVDITEATDSFVYIDGSFRPSSRKILSLLSGTALYSNRLSAVRELLQNAFDAVREQIALERLESEDPGDPEVARAISARRRVRLVIEKEDDSYWLRCSDNGTGMSKDVIERYLLVGGADVRPEVRSLERTARTAGFEVGRTGQFGIGILSYFMICDRLELVTRKSQEAGDTDNTGWKFTTEGIDSFGELRKESRTTSGTDVRLRLTTANDPAEFEDWKRALTHYVRRTVQWSPCRFDFVDESGNSLVSNTDGWIHTPPQDGDSVLESLESGESQDLATPSERDEFRKTQEKWRALKLQASPGIQWFGPVCAEIGDIASARFWVPYWSHQGNASLVIFSMKDDFAVDFLPDGRIACDITCRDQTSWRGFSADGPAPIRSNVCGQIDYRSGLTISVNREDLDYDEEAPFLSEISSLSENILSDFLREHAQSKFSLINLVMAAHSGRISVNPLPTSDRYWPVINKETDTVLCKLDGPLVDFRVFHHWRSRAFDNATFNGNDILVAAEIDSSAYGRSAYRVSGCMSGGRLVLAGNEPSPDCLVAVLWDDGSDIAHSTYVTAAFPPRWDSLTAVVDAWGTIYNIKCPRYIPDESKTLLNVDDKGIGEFLESATSARDFIGLAVDRPVRFWKYISETYPDEFIELLRLAEVTDESPLHIWHRDGLYSADATFIVRPSGTAVCTGALSKDGLKLADGAVLPFPDEDWWVRTVQNGSRSKF